MIDIEKIKSAARKHLEGSTLYVVDVVCSPSNAIEITLDGDDGVGIEDCAALSRAVEAALDREEEDFQLTVGSAGLGQPLKDERQYRRLVGRRVDVVLRSGVKLSGIMTGFSGGELTLAFTERVPPAGGKRGETVETVRTYSLSDIKTTREHIDFQ